MLFFQRFSTLQIALGFSLAVHAVLVFARFADPEGFKRVFQDTPLEVILVNARSSEAPTQAQAIAQANLTGGGELERGRATSPLPPSPTMTLGDADEDTQKRVEQLQQVQQQLLAQLKQELALVSPPDPKQDKGTPAETSLEEKRRKQTEQLAEIAKRVKEENERPKKRFVSPATQEKFSAMYQHNASLMIENRGTRSFPTHKGVKLYGELILSVTIAPDGRVVETEIDVPSRSRALDRQAVAIVYAAAPFGKFNDSMRAHGDLYVFTWRFSFTRDGGLETTAMQR
ncbi:MAG: energy transducer TonB [Burkholderiales bacterium]